MSAFTDPAAAGELICGPAPKDEPVRVPLDPPLGPSVSEYERRGAAAEAAQEAQFADFWGGQGPDYEAMADRDAAEPGPDLSPWWDGERIHYGDKNLEAGQ